MTRARNGSTDVFIAKFDPAAATGPDSLVYSTYFGGSGRDYVNDLAVDASGNVYATGYTNSGNLPLTGDAHDSVLSGTTDAFVIILGAGGNTLDYSTYLGGDATETGYALALDANNNIYIGGNTGSNTGLATGGVYDNSYNGSTDGFVAKLLANRDPVATDNVYTTSEGVAVGGNVITDDTGAGIDSDPDTDPLTASLLDGPLHGTLVLNPDGTFTYTPFDTPTTNFADTDSFTYQVNDGKGGTDTATVTITVTPDANNEAPVNSVPGAQTTGQDIPLVFSEANGNRILVRDDAGGNAIEVTLTATNGSLSLDWPSSAPVTEGAETPVNTYTTNVQTTQQGFASAESVAMDASGNYVVVWESVGQDGDLSGTYAQLYNADGTTNGAEFRVNITTTGNQREPTVAMDDAGNFVVVWTGNGVGDSAGIFYRRYDAAGNALDATDQLVNTTTNSTQRSPAVAMDGNGDFVIAWSGEGSGDDDGVFYRRYDASGTAQDAAEVKVNTTTDQVQRQPALAMDPAGNFVVSWSSDDDPSNSDDWNVHLQRYDVNGNAVGGNILVNSYTTDAQFDSSVAMDADSNVIVTWESDDDPSNSDDFNIYLQRYDAAGNTIGVNTLVNSTTAQDQRDPSVAVDAAGHFAVTWASDDDATAGNEWNIYLQKYDAAGTTVGLETRVNSTISGDQQGASIAMSASGDFVIAWNGEGGSDPDGIYSQRYTGGTGLSFTSGDGGNNGTMTITGSVADINAALDGLIFTPDAGYLGAASLLVETNDLGNAPVAAPQTDSDLININVIDGQRPAGQHGAGRPDHRHRRHAAVLLGNEHDAQRQRPGCGHRPGDADSDQRHGQSLAPGRAELQRRRRDGRRNHDLHRYGGRHQRGTGRCDLCRDGGFHGHGERADRHRRPGQHRLRRRTKRHRFRQHHRQRGRPGTVDDLRERRGRDRQHRYPVDHRR